MLFAFIISLFYTSRCQKSIEFSPNSAESHYYYGWALRFAGRFNEAITNLKKAIRLNPITPLHYLNGLAWAYTYTEQYKKAILIWKQCLERNPDYLFAPMGLTLAFNYQVMKTWRVNQPKKFFG